MDIPVAKVRKVLKIAQEPISLETPIGEEEDSHLGDFIEDRQAVSPSEAVISVNLKEYTRRFCARSPARGTGDQDAFRPGRRLRAHAGRGWAELPGDARAHSPDEAKALRKLRHPSRSRKLKAFVEGVKRCNSAASQPRRFFKAEPQSRGLRLFVCGIR